VTSRLAAVTNLHGQTSAYTYLDNLGDHRLQTIHHKYPNGSTLSKFDYTYNAVGNILTWRQQSDTTAVVWEYGYDAADQLTAAVKKATDPQATVLQRYAYAYDPAGNRTSEQIDDAVTSSTYDRLNHLGSQQGGGPVVFKGSVNEPATVTVNSRSATVTPDNRFEGKATLAVGTTTVNITATDPSGNAATAVYEVDQAASGKTFSYDANGNLTNDGTRTFEWDAADRLVAVNVGTHRSEFTYDGFDQRVRIVEKENGTIVSDQPFIWNGNQIAERRTVTGSTGTTRVYRFGLQDNGAARYLTQDQVLSIRETTDDSGTIQARYDYAPFGAATKVTGSGSDVLEYTGAPVHEASGLFLMKRRAYDPAMARWLSEDPIGLKAGPNLYAYVVNDPLRWIDPEGTRIVMPLPWLPNGNVGDWYNRQDNICSQPMGALGFNGAPCIKKCCQAHDDCYAASRCNWTSWLAIAYDSACTRCNRTAVMCILNADARPDACRECEKK